MPVVQITWRHSSPDRVVQASAELMVVQWIEAHAAPWQADIRPTPKRFSNDETRTHEPNPLLNWPPPTVENLRPASQRHHKLPTRVHVRARQLIREAKTHEIARNSLSAATHIQRTTLLAVKTIWRCPGTKATHGLPTTKCTCVFRRRTRHTQSCSCPRRP